MRQEAIDKLAREREETKFAFHDPARAMRDAVAEALTEFCRQDEEFAQAVVQGGGFADCMAAVSKDVVSVLSDLEAYRRAVRFYFPGADIRFQMTVDLCAAAGGDAPPVVKPGGLRLNLADFM